MSGERAEARRQFLAAAGCAGWPVTALAGDASPRRYFRVGGDPGRRAILMDDAAGGAAATGRFAALAEHLRHLGFRAPAIRAAAAEAGLLLLEDLGDDLLTRRLARLPAAEGDGYAAAIDLLLELHRHPPPERVAHAGAGFGIEPYDLAALLAEASLVTDWWLPGAGVTREGLPNEGLREEFRGLVAASLAVVAADRSVLVLRDFHADNLLWLGEAAAPWRRLGVIDFQDALAGHPAYDLVSLLRDARRDTSPALRAAMLARYQAGRDQARGQRAEFLAACAALGAQRNLKILGIFARLCRRDGKPAYLDLTPRVWRHLLDDLAHPALAELARWVRAHVPAPTAAVRARLRAAGAGE